MSYKKRMRENLRQNVFFVFFLQCCPAKGKPKNRGNPYGGKPVERKTNQEDIQQRENPFKGEKNSKEESQ